MSEFKIRAGICDLNGIWRGKLMPAAQLEKLQNGMMRMPFSAPTLDIWGHDIRGSKLVFETGDADGICLPTGRGPLRETWLGSSSRFLPVWMTDENGAPSMVDPRQILARVIGMLAEHGLTPVMALEMEFYLVDASDVQPKSPKSPISGATLDGDSILSMQDIDHFDGFFADVYAACADYGIPADAAISESGAGQFEINLLHINDPLRAADNAQFFKRIVKGVARKHGMAASFMAKPYLDRAGSGMHVHFSMLDAAGNNIFDDGGEDGTPELRHAIGGLLDNMAASTLIFAPHLNSYRRLTPGAHAPTGIGWGYENRTTAIRIPGGLPAARRIEHRVAGADANPYLLVAAILAGALDGLERHAASAEPIAGNAYEAGLQQLPNNWEASTSAFEQNDFISKYLSPLFHQMFASIKRQELQEFNNHMTDFEISTYLESI